jgi:hypothetical protein
MSADLTKEQIEAIRLRADSGFAVLDDEWNSLCDMALRQLSSPSASVAIPTDSVIIQEPGGTLVIPPGPLQIVGKRLCELLDAEHWNEIEPWLIKVGHQLAAAPAEAAPDRHADSMYRAAFLSGWQACVRGDDKALDAVSKRVGKVEDYVTAKPAEAVQEPAGYAVTMDGGWYVGIYRDEETAKTLAPKHPKGAVVPLYYRSAATKAPPPEVAPKVCRADGRCQYAIDHGAEGMGHCPVGKCAMPAEAAPPPLYAGNVFMIDGKPHRTCDCSPSINKCARGLPRTLLTTEFSRCMVPV